MKKTTVLLALLIIFPLITACNSMLHGVRDQSAKRLAYKNHMYKRVIGGGFFNITAYERVNRRGKPATIYIEGDGQGFFMDHDTPFNPTPVNPIGMQLAAVDQSPNVIYLGRPCQYTSDANTERCPERYWTTHRYAPEVIEAYEDVLDQLRRLHSVPAFHVVGYDGGGAVAMLLAARRKDILTVRTVAGVLDHAVMRTHMERDALLGSMNPVNITQQLKNIPQHHFIGGQDDITPPSVFFSYKQAMGPSRCMRYTLVEPAEHIRGWYERWDRLLRYPVDCSAPQVDPNLMPTLPPMNVAEKTLGEKTLGGMGEKTLMRGNEKTFAAQPPMNVTRDTEMMNEQYNPQVFNAPMQQNQYPLSIQQQSAPMQQQSMPQAAPSQPVFAPMYTNGPISHGPGYQQPMTQQQPMAAPQVSHPPQY